MRTVQDVIGDRCNNFTVIRLVLSSSVIWAHAFGMTFDHSVSDVYSLTPLAHVASLGGLAVDGFFFLSGLFVAQSLFRDRDIVAYAVRRTFRIIPGLFVCLLVTALLGAVLCHPLDGWKFLLFTDTFRYVVRNTLLDLNFSIPGVFEALPQRMAINGSIHTLGLEAKMYLWLALASVVGLLSARRLFTLNGVIVAGLVVAYPEFFTVPLHVPDYGREPIAMFAFGVAVFGLADLIAVRAWQAVPLLAAVLVTSGTTHTVLFFVAFAWTILFVGQSSILGRRELLRTDASYGIYVYGWPATQFIAQINPSLNPYVLAVLGIALAAILGFASWRLVERPWIDLGSILIGFWREPARARNLWGARRIPEVMRRPLHAGAAVTGAFLACLVAWPVTNAYPFGPRLRLPVTITEFGPHSTRVGEPFNLVGSGQSAMWFLTDRKPEVGFSVVIGHLRIEPTVGDGSTSILVPPEVYSAARTYPVYFEHRYFDHVERSNVMMFEIKQ